MTNIKRNKKIISKELMFSKIMPTYMNNSFSEYLDNENIKSEPDTFKISEKVLKAMGDRGPMQDPPERPVVPQRAAYRNDDYEPPYQDYQQMRQMSRQASQAPDYQQYYQGRGAQPQATRVFPVQTPDPVPGQPAEAPVQYAAPAPKPEIINDDKPKYINLTEEVLYSKLSNMIAMFKCCNCEKCRQHIMLQVLNNVKPEYVYKKPSEVKELIESNNYVDINQPIIRAILDTKANPPHKK